MLDYETKFKIMETFNSNMNTPYLFIINRFKDEWKESKLRLHQIHFTDLENKILNDENIKLITNNMLHETEKNLKLGLNKLEQLDFKRNNWNEIDKKMEFTDQMFKNYHTNKEQFEKDNLIFLNWMSDKTEGNETYGMSLLNPYVVYQLEKKEIGEEFLRVFKETKWTAKDIITLNESFLNPFGLSLILHNDVFEEFTKVYLDTIKALKFNIKDLDIENNSIREGILSVYSRLSYGNYTSGYLDDIDVSIQAYPEEEKIWSFCSKDKNKNILFLLENEEYKSSSMIKEIMRCSYFGRNKQKTTRAKSAKNINDYIEILLDQRNYEYVVFDIKMKKTNFSKILLAFDELNKILVEKTNRKISFEFGSNSNNYELVSFSFKVDSRCFTNKDDLSVYLKDLLIEVFSLDVKTANQDIKNYEKNVPVIKDLISYMDKCLEECNKKTVNKPKM